MAKKCVWRVPAIQREHLSLHVLSMRRFLTWQCWKSSPPCGTLGQAGPGRELSSASLCSSCTPHSASQTCGEMWQVWAPNSSSCWNERSSCVYDALVATRNWDVWCLRCVRGEKYSWRKHEKICSMEESVTDAKLVGWMKEILLLTPDCQE